MNFEFDLNALIPFEITKFTSDLRIIPYGGGENENFSQLSRENRLKLGHVIDRIGEASSKAQGLKEIITTYRKFSQNEQHRIYLMKAHVNASKNTPSLVGLLKVGEKRLFVFDHKGNYHEMSPLCVLDFYVHESQQRRGFGRKLFDYMLACEQVLVEHLAIDSPSEKCVRFLKKHYDLKQPIPQSNNFVVFPGFFDNRPSLFRRGGGGTGQMLPGLTEQRKFEAYSAKPYYNKVDDLSPYNDPRFNYIHRTGSVDSRLQRQEFINRQDKIGANQNVNTQPNANNQRPMAQPPREFLGYQNPNQNQNISFHKTYSMYDILCQQQQAPNPYDPFPSLKKLGANSAAPALSRPPLPPPRQTNDHSAIVNNYTVPQVIVNNANNRNQYDPFPSLKNVPEFYSSPSYMNNKFRKTRLW